MYATARGYRVGSVGCVRKKASAKRRGRGPVHVGVGVYEEEAVRMNTYAAVNI